MKRTPMRRTGWSRRPKTPEPAVEPPPAAFSTASRKPAAVMALAMGFAGSIHKEVPIRSEAYRRAVAALPCCICGVSGHSQAAHANAGKGAAIKSDDRTCIPLCADRPGVRGCHGCLDQGALFTREERRRFEREKGRETRHKIVAAGRWPPELPPPGDDFFCTESTPDG